MNNIILEKRSLIPEKGLDKSAFLNMIADEVLHFIATCTHGLFSIKLTHRFPNQKNFTKHSNEMLCVRVISTLSQFGRQYLGCGEKREWNPPRLGMDLCDEIV